MLFGIEKTPGSEGKVKQLATAVIGQDMTVSAAAAAGLILTGFTATGLFVGYAAGQVVHRWAGITPAGSGYALTETVKRDVWLKRLEMHKV